MSPVHDLLTEQIGHEFFASQQYVAIAVWYDQQALPQLAAHFYAQAVEERNHAMMIVQYLMDREAEVVIPGVPAVRNDFASVVEPLELALAQERLVTSQFEALIALARAESDYLGEQFMHWFLKEQVEEVASISTLLQVGRRVGENVMLLEDYLARESGSGGGADPTAPAAAGGAL
ncbi:MAG TPA: ferritin [Candidatus Limnocylindrales bacterium]|nr:ferritin [Candidatus Limnocylindrales bacterium]